MTADAEHDQWHLDEVMTAGGVAIPVRATSRRPRWEHLPSEVRAAVEAAAGGSVVDSWSAGTGFTPGFASRLDLADGRSVFVKAASSADDHLHGWTLSEAYRTEVDRLEALPDGIGAPRLLWHIDETLAGESWIIAAWEYVDAAPPRRPWRHDELQLVLDKLTATALVLKAAPEGLQLDRVSDDFADYPAWVTRVRERDGRSRWLETVAELAAEMEQRCAGSAVVHLDLRDDNLLIGRRDREVWIVDWNFPYLGAAWVPLVTVLLSAAGDGHDADAILTTHPLSREVAARDIDSFLAVLWLYFTTSRERDVPTHSPHLRDHQAWYADVTRDWLSRRLGTSADD